MMYASETRKLILMHNPAGKSSVIFRKMYL